MGKNRSDIRRHLDAEGGSAMLAIRNIVCHLDVMTDEQKAAINWHAGQSVSLAVMRLIAIDDYRAVGAKPKDAARLRALLNRLRDQIEELPLRYSVVEFECEAMAQTFYALESLLSADAVDPDVAEQVEPSTRDKSSSFEAAPVPQGERTPEREK